VVVRTWNLFHGNTVPPGRRAFLREMVELATADDPDVVCLQEVPVWALQRLGGWSGMEASVAIAKPPLVRSAGLGRRLTELHHGILRSAFTGEGIAILARTGLGGEARSDTVGPNRLLLSLELDVATVGCFHVTGGAVASDQFRRVIGLLDDDRLILAGDVNLRPPYDLAGFSAPLPGSIDQILVRGLPSTPPVAWPEERRRVDGRLLSDHAPVELTVG